MNQTLALRPIAAALKAFAAPSRRSLQPAQTDGSHQACASREPGVRTMRRHTLLPLGFAALSGLAGVPDAAFAEETQSQSSAAPVAQSGEQTLPEVKVRDRTQSDDYVPTVSTIGGKTPTPVMDIPQSVTIINRAVMDAQGATSLQDALRNVPGITFGGAEGGVIGNNINLRGFTARTDLYLDGIRDRGQYYRDVFSLDAVEVLKGPSSMLFGRGSTGGVINQVSKVPSLTPSNYATLGVGTQPMVRVTADINQPMSETSAFRVALMGQDVHSSRDVMKNENYGIAPSVRFGIGTPTDVILSALLLHNNDMPDYGLPPVNGQPADVNRGNFYGLTNDRTTQDVGEVRARVVHKLTPELTLQNQTQYSQYNIDARESGPGAVGTRNSRGVFVPIPGGTVTGNFTTTPLNQLFVQIAGHDRSIFDHSIYNQTDLIANFYTGSIGHQLLAGLELGYDDYENQAYARPNLPVVWLQSPLEQAGNTITIRGNYANARATTVAPYVNDTITFTPNWKVVAGLRWDYYDATLNNTISLPRRTDQSVDFLSVRAGLMYEPSSLQTYYVSYGTSFNPSIETLTVVNGTQNLDPEENQSIEAGGKWAVMEGNLLLTSALFQTKKKNARTQVSTGVYELTGEVRVNGFEATAAGRITRDWQVLAGYTYLDAEITEGSTFENTKGNVPLNTPRNSTSLWTTYNITPEWQVGGGMTTMSGRFANNTNTVRVGDYVRVDATVAYLQQQYEVRLNVFNLFNKLNFDQLIASQGGRSVPGTNTQALLTFTYRF
ncbi:MAG TPA: TonB-dependent siderophore receptor [Burkholderiales bacterium]|nr:TonB-dependent siderophore receptor [Burkholderiales bacterium]